MKIEKKWNIDSNLLLTSNIKPNDKFALIEISKKLKPFKLRVKRFDDAETLVKAINKNDFSYWLSHEDIAEIARLEYSNFAEVTGGSIQFEIIGSFTQLASTLTTFINKIKTSLLPKARLSLIINLNNLHWVSMAISYEDESYVSYYVDSKRNAIPSEYIEKLDELNIVIVDLSPRFIQQTDDYNCGLWALENTFDLSQLIDEKKDLHWAVNRLARPRDKDYFIEKRIFYSEKLEANPVLREKNYSPFQELNIERKLFLSSQLTSLSKPNPKRIKTSPDPTKKEKEKVISLLFHYVETFMSYFTKELGNYHLLSKKTSVTEAALKAELKTGLTGALVGVTIAQSLIGSIPSLTASVRAIVDKCCGLKDKAPKITRIFSEANPETLSNMLAEAAVNIFYSLESQFMQITDKAGDQIAIEKLAEDAVDRMFNALNQYFDFTIPISAKLLEASILYGPSEKYFDPDIKQARIKVLGYLIETKSGVNLKTSDLYEKTHLINSESEDSSSKFYIRKKFLKNKLGFRRLLTWEKDSQGGLKESLKSFYEVENQALSPEEEKAQLTLTKSVYILKNYAENQAEAQRILNKISTRYSSETFIKPINKKPIYFNLRKPVHNFSGRVDVLKRLHEILMSKRTTAIVPARPALSVDPFTHTHKISVDSNPFQTSSGSQLSISGLGGIGKTQLALRYAELYAAYYDHNVLWINAETIENIAYSFRMLAERIQISRYDSYNQEKSLTTLVEEVYAYFSDRKSLFIFDNVENYRAVEAYLPKTRPDNKPTVLITSRYSHWNGMANVLSLEVFTEQETVELINKNFPGSTQDHNIFELNKLLQGLPLALQQAVAYIKLRKKTESNFSFSDYIKLYTEKSQELLNFDLYVFFNDPYLKTIFTTWHITLEKIEKEPLGKDAIDVLNIMAFLYPDMISTSKTLYFRDSIKKNTIELNQIMHLLTSYSMINFDGQTQYSIHRLVQETMRLQLQKNPAKFEYIFYKTHFLMIHWKKNIKNDVEAIFHYFYFLLNGITHDKIIAQTIYKNPEKNLLDTLLLDEGKYCHYFIDLAFIKFTTQKFVQFLSVATAYYIKMGSFFTLNTLFLYIKDKYYAGSLTNENIKYFFNYYDSFQSPIFKLKSYSKNLKKRESQEISEKKLADFREKILTLLMPQCPRHYLKRSACLHFNEQENKKIGNRLKIKYHFEKISHVSHYIGSGLMTKDTFSALVQGHFDDVAINLGLITSSTFFGEISNRLLMQGKSLASEAHVLEKNLNLENKRVLQILWNKEILSAGKITFLGKAMQVASPFIAKVTSIFFAYNLNNEVQTYKQGHQEVLPSIVSNSVILGVEGVEAVIEGAEFLGFIVGASVFTATIGEWIALTAWISSEVYDANQQLDEIEKYVHLSRGEAFFEFLLSFLHQAPLEYIQLKAENGQRVESAINFLKKNTAIQSFIFPSAFFPEDLCKTRKVFLDQKINFTLDESNPDQPREGNVFCLVASPPPENLKNKNTNYVCHKALGVRYSRNRTGNSTLINLGEGDEDVIAFSDTPNVFFLNNGKKSYHGGDSGNLFDLQGNAIMGILHGGKGTDILLLDNFHPGSSYVLLDALGSLCEKDDSVQHIPPLCPDARTIQINQIDQIYGRKNQADIIYLSPSISFIDGLGGKNKAHPDSFFITARSNKDLTLTLRNNTFITFFPIVSTTSVNYKIPSNEVGNTSIHYSFEQPIQHQLFFECAVHALDLIFVEKNTAHISVQVNEVSDKKTFSITISDQINFANNQTQNITQFYKNFYYRFSDMDIKLINKDTLYGKEIVANNKTIDEKISLFSALANRLEKSFSVQLLNNVTLSIGRENKHEIFYINSLFESHLVGNGGENVYTILANNDTVFPLPKITLYDSDGIDPNELIEQLDSLDLREIVKKYKEIYPDAVIASHVFSSENDLIITLSNAACIVTLKTYYKNCFLPWATIKLKNTLLNNINGYQKIIFFLDEHPKNIVPLENDFWTLASEPIIFTTEKKIIFLTNFDLEEDSIIHISKKIGDFAFFRNEVDLILTNTFTLSTDYCTLIFSKFYTDSKMKKKVLSSTFNFFDRTIYPKNYQQKIDHAAHFQHLTQLFLTNASDSKVHSFLNTLDIIPANDDQEKLPLPGGHRRKRHVNHLPQSNRMSEEDRIFAIADDYLSKYDHAILKSKAYPRKRNNNSKPLKKENLNASSTLQEKHTPMRKPSLLAKAKNSDNYFKHRKPNYFSQNNLDQAQKLTEKKYQLPVNSNLAKSTKANFFKDANLIKKQTTFIPKNALRYHENNNLNGKTSSMVSKLTTEKNYSSSKKSNVHPSSSYTEHPDFHNTLVFMDFITKAIKGRSKPLSYDKKLTKNINKAQRLRENVKTKLFGLTKSP